MTVLLTACGGGGGSPVDTQPPPSSTPTPTSQDLANAQSAKLSAAFDTANQTVTLTWTDTFAKGVTYNVEQQAADGTWSTIAAVPGAGDPNTPLTWSRAMPGTTTVRVAAQMSGYEVPLNSVSGGTSIQVVIPGATPTIALDQEEPVSGTVNAHIRGGGSYTSVTYYVDLGSDRNSAGGPNYDVAIDTTQLAAGTHLLLARLARGPDSHIDIRKTITVSNSQVRITTALLGVWAGKAYLDVQATSPSGIASVTADIDGHRRTVAGHPDSDQLVPGQFCQS